MDCAPKEKSWEVSSPDKNLTLTLTWRLKDTTGCELSYAVTSNFDKKTREAILPSPLGIKRKDADFTKGLKPDEAGKVTEFDDTYRMMTGKQKEIRNHGNELSIGFKNNSGKKLVIDLRAYDNGVAFRYRFPEKDSLEYTVTGELTGFKIPGSAKCWMQPYDSVTQYSPAYETYYQNGIDAGTRSPKNEGWSFPALFESNGLWILLTESNLEANFYGAHLQPGAADGLYTIRLPEKEEALGKCPVDPSSSLPWYSPWRLIIIGPSPATIIESNLVNNLADSSTITDTTWIKPGIASWSWWSDPPSPRDYTKQLPFVDFSKKMGWPYILVDANWDRMKNGNVDELVKYASQRNVRIWLWYNSGGPYNTVTEEPRNRMFDREKRQEEFTRLEKLGIKGVKVDFFQSDKPDVIRLYHDILADAAAHKIMVNFHGCTIPRGWARTYPNNLSCEAVKGAENYQFDHTFPEEAPVQNTILPFTRNAIGSMDYTPLTFSDQTFKHLTTDAHELALSVIFESGIEHFADKVSAYLAAPDFVQKFLGEVSSTWDETRYLAGYPGQYVVLARRSHGTWFVGGINGQTKEQSVTLSMPFIDEGEYLIEIITDGEKPKSFLYYKKPFGRDIRLPITLKPRGGMVARLIPENM